MCWILIHVRKICPGYTAVLRDLQGSGVLTAGESFFRTPSNCRQPGVYLAELGCLYIPL